MAADLLKKGRTNVKGMWSEKKGSTYDAAVILDDTGGKYINFKLEFPKRKTSEGGFHFMPVYGYDKGLSLCRLCDQSWQVQRGASLWASG